MSGDKNTLGSQDDPWEEWTGTGSGNAPMKLSYNTIGFDGDGLLYKYTKSTNTWTATLQTFDGFIGL